jgi:hypothetical protein
MKITTIITSTALIACMSLGALSSATAADIAVKITPTMGLCQCQT